MFEQYVSNDHCRGVLLIETLLRPSLKPQTSTKTALLPLKIISVKQNVTMPVNMVLIRLKSSLDSNEISKYYKLLTLYNVN